MGYDAVFVPFLIPFEAVAFSDARFDGNWMLTALARIELGVFPRRKAKQSEMRVGATLYELVPRFTNEGEAPVVWEEVPVNEKSDTLVAMKDPKGTLRLLSGSSTASTYASTAATRATAGCCGQCEPPKSLDLGI